jgi:glycosyltransferase involved in cell wall biosynthesis
MLKIAVATIALNEEKFVDRFMDSAQEADGVFVLDTGSSDKTVEKLKNRGANVEIGIVKPWRFDIPRNIALSMVPFDFDIVVSFDLDEVFTVGWVDAIRKAWVPGTTRLRYPYAWSHNADGSPATKFYYDKIVQRRGYRWVKPVHEILQLYGEPEVQSWTDAFMLHHWPDTAKSRGSYLPLLELAVKEEPNDDRSCHYLGREYMYYGMYHKAIEELQRHLALPSATWNAERAASMRFISRCHVNLGMLPEAKVWAFKACTEAPLDREPYYELAKVAYAAQDFNLLYYAASTTLKTGEAGKTYISDPESWGYLPHDYAALGAHNIGFKAAALKHGAEALLTAQRMLEPKHVIDRLTNNITFYEAA